MDVSPYIEGAFVNRKHVVNRAVRILKAVQKNHPFDAIAFRGLSGALIAPAIADRLDVHIVAVRKPNDGSHSCGRIVESPINTPRYIIVDDFISSGETVKAIRTAINTQYNCAVCVGVYQWAENREEWSDDDFDCQESELGMRTLNQKKYRKCTTSKPTCKNVAGNLGLIVG